MDFSDGFVSKEHWELHRSASESADPLSASPLPVSPRSHKFPKSSKSPKSPKIQGKHGKGTPLNLFAIFNIDCLIFIVFTNYVKERVNFEEYKKKATIVVEEYFATDDITSTANKLIELDRPTYSYYFVKKLVSKAMDRHDKEKEMAAVLLSGLYADYIDPPQVYKGFCKLIESADDFIVDIPDTVDVLALFIARAVVDDILPPAFLKKQMNYLPKDSKGIEVLKRVEKGYLGAPLHAEIIERRWGGSKKMTVEDVKAKINDLLIEYVVSGEKKEACRCIKDLKVPFFHHEIVKRALVMAMERCQVEGQLLDLLKEAAEEGLINSSQVSKGFSRMIDYVDDLSLDIPNARGILQSLISNAASEGWLCASSLKSLSLQPKKRSLEDSVAKVFKTKAQSIIQEYLSGDISEVNSSLESENSTYSPELNVIFVKRLITLAMDWKNREKEMASILLSSLCFPADDVVNGFVMLLESADDTALDNPVVVEDLAMFLARSVVDEVLAPQHLEEIGSQCLAQESIGSKVLKMAKSLLKARLSGEQILRCWGGGGRPGWAVEDVKDKIGKLLEEFESGGDVREACRCMKELGMPFFNHEVVKKALVTIMEKKNERLWILLEVCFGSGLITMNQMAKGFGRVAESLDDLALDVPDAQKQFTHYVERAKNAGWLDSSYCFSKSGHSTENGTG
ncbi:programmed cell death protein 4-like [Pyrus ussuriensis x Pyrus communis]|uniref:Programmed cell death protein 4-like n=1 Tax=Pyrus ussuriensis x Pyrus communis TaxID=2448454 RepID=A0A5N5FQ96_9ROSA|nr:programmed cell death protein 4-like [Pyrus ussuriensis x Pyrus communis]